MSRHRTTPTRQLLPLWAAALVVLAPLLVAGPGVAAPPASRAVTSSEARTGTLKVRVAALPGNRKVVVRGPQRFKRVLTSTTVLRGLAPGRYRVKAAKVRTDEWRAYPEVRKSRPKVRAGRSTVTRVTYPTVISSAAKVLTTHDIKDFVAPSSTDATGEITLSRRAAEGTVLAAGLTPETPQGALLAVLSSKKAATGWVHRVRIAGIQEAVLRGEYDVPIDTAVPIQARLGVAAPMRGTGSTSGCSGSMEAGAERPVTPTSTGPSAAGWPTGSGTSPGRPTPTCRWGSRSRRPSTPAHGRKRRGPAPPERSRSTARTSR